MSDLELISMFDSIGMDCEFGGVQRRAGFNPPGLLRFGSISLGNLMRGLETGFEGIGAWDSVEIFWKTNEYYCLDKLYGLSYHTCVRDQGADTDSLRERETKRLPFLARLLRENLTQARKILVSKHGAPLNDQQLLRLHETLRHYGPNTVLRVEPSESVNEPVLKRVGAGLLRVFVPRPVAPAPLYPLMTYEQWINMCRHLLAQLSDEERPALAPAAG
jgi:hypothetical protein